MIYFLLFGIPGAFVLIHFIRYFWDDRGPIEPAQYGFVEIFCLLILPALFLSIMDINTPNSCCDDTALFSPAHRLSLYTLIILCLLAYFYSSYRQHMATPIFEVLTNCFLVIGIILNVVIALQVKYPPFWIIGNVPIILLFILMLARNHQMFLEYYQGKHYSHTTKWEALAWRLLLLPPLLRMPVLLVLCLPLLVLLSAALLLFGQKPDSFISAFTQTYRQGLSQINSQCDSVVCDGHYLCTIAAKGHEKVVKPVRLGVRGGQTIICNRQLLVSNAFEELLAEKLPWVHKPVRKFYNKIGKSIHRYYGLFNHKWLSDSIYILMKPLEWFFLLVLYSCDKNPENRIARQYLPVTGEEKAINPLHKRYS
jgi:hypothetical protein